MYLGWWQHAINRSLLYVVVFRGPYDELKASYITVEGFTYPGCRILGPFRFLLGVRSVGLKPSIKERPIESKRYSCVQQCTMYKRCSTPRQASLCVWKS